MNPYMMPDMLKAEYEYWYDDEGEAIPTKPKTSAFAKVSEYGEPAEEKQDKKWFQAQLAEKDRIIAGLNNVLWQQTKEIARLKKLFDEYEDPFAPEEKEIEQTTNPFTGEVTYRDKKTGKRQKLVIEQVYTGHGDFEVKETFTDENEEDEIDDEWDDTVGP